MTDAQRAARENHVSEGTHVIIPNESGYRVYAAHDPSRMYEVRMEEGRFQCTCPEFNYHQADSNWRCEHIRSIAPMNRAPGKNGAVVANGSGAHPPATAAGGNGTEPEKGALMLIRRSVSPDGRIDSVSVEFTLPVAGDSNGAIKDKALRTLSLQKEIVTHFLGGPASNGNGHAASHDRQNGHHANGGHSNGAARNGDGTSPARILEIGEVPGKWGPRLCLNFQVSGNRTRLFGSAKQLAEHLADAGYDYTPDDLRSGLRLNLDCRVTTQPSDDGKFLNVEKVFPPANGVAH